MKYFFASVVASLVAMQSLQAIPSNLGESMREYQTILDSALIQETIPPSEFIFDIKRKTKHINASIIRYIVKTHLFGTPRGVQGLIARSSSEENEYKVKMTASPNPEIGPPILEVVKVVKVHHSHSH